MADQPTDSVKLDEIPKGAIVVGHDGSEHATAAVATAAKLADEISAPLVVLRAFTIAQAPRSKDWSFGYVPTLEEFASAVGEELDADIAAVRAEYPNVDLRVDIVHGGAAKTLIAASAAARVVVVGSRGMGGFKTLLLGSVSDQVVRYAECPVLVDR